MYSWMPESNDTTSVTEDRKGNNPVRLLFVDIDAASKAGHAVESASEMQLCAMLAGILLARRPYATLRPNGSNRRRFDLGRDRGCKLESSSNDSGTSPSSLLQFQGTATSRCALLALLPRAHAHPSIFAGPSIRGMSSKCPIPTSSMTFRCCASRKHSDGFAAADLSRPTSLSGPVTV